MQYKHDHAQFPVNSFLSPISFFVQLKVKYVHTLSPSLLTLLHDVCIETKRAGENLYVDKWKKMAENKALTIG